MSVKISSEVWQNSQHKGGDLLVLLVLADFANDDGICWPSVEVLGKKSRMQRRNVQRCLRALEDSGEIVRMKTGGMVDGAALANVYRVRIEGRQIVAHSSGGASPMTLIGASNTTKRGVTHDALTTKEPSEDNHQGVLLGISSQKEQAGLNELPLPFDSASFKTAFDDYRQMRKEKKKPLTPISISRLFKQFREWGETPSIAAINKSVTNGWTGVFPVIVNAPRSVGGFIQTPSSRKSAAQQGAV